MKTEISLNDRCYNRARDVWWSVGSCLLPSDLINELVGSDDDLFIILMDEREQVLSEAYSAVQYLFKIAQGHMESPGDDEVDSYGECAVQKGHDFGKKLSDMKRIWMQNDKNKERYSI
jgi:hypothetical protein